MGKLSYVIKRARKMDYRAMLKTADMLHKKTGKSRIWLMADMAKCAAKYNAGYVDYKIAEMYRLNDAQRATQITRGISNNIVARMNDKKFWHFFDNKTEFNQLFHEQVKREWLNFSTATEDHLQADRRFERAGNSQMHAGGLSRRSRALRAPQGGGHRHCGGQGHPT